MASTIQGIPRTRFTFARSRFSEASSHSLVEPLEDYESEQQGFVPVVESDVEVSVEDEDEDGYDEHVDEEIESVEDVGNDDDHIEEDEMVYEQQGMSSSSSSVVNNANGDLQAGLTDPDVLDCPICVDPLCAPVFQCENGHVACSSCRSKVNRKCPSCSMPIGDSRCRAIERLIEALKFSCKNAQYGCTKTMTYREKSEHEQMCPHVVCFCPHSSCPYTNSSKNLYIHFGIQHAASTIRFTYDTPFFVDVTTDQNHIFLQEQHESVIFILNQQVKGHDRAFDVDCVGPSMLNTCYAYELTAKSMEATLILQCVPKMYTVWSAHALRKNCLTFSSDFLDCNETLSLKVCIKKAISFA